MEETKKTRKCECCGKELPESEFIQRHFGASRICKRCNAEHIAKAKERKKQVATMESDLENARSLRLVDFTPRELMQELAKRGYKGKLVFTQVREIDLESL